MFPIAAITFREAIRKKIVLLAGLLTLSFVALYGTGLYYAGSGMPTGVGEAVVRTAVVQQMLIMGLFMGSFIVSVTAIFAAVGTVSSEVDNGILYAVLARPIKRRNVILGKFIGCASLVTIFSLVLYAAIIVLAKTLIGVATSSEIPAILLLCVQPLLLTAVAVTFSTFLTTLGSGVAAFALYAIAFVGGFVEQVGAIIGVDKLTNAGIIASLISPSDSLYRKAIGVISPTGGSSPLEMMRSGPFGAVSTPSTAMLVYAGIYLVLMLALAVGIFNKRDIS
ncbi:MAG: ABC transporter permease [Chloroflexi bacterium]|nr:ABC transporter permease [Chloroflexota bacterium]